MDCEVDREIEERKGKKGFFLLEGREIMPSNYQNAACFAVQSASTKTGKKHMLACQMGWDGPGLGCEQ